MAPPPLLLLLQPPPPPLLFLASPELSSLWPGPEKLEKRERRQRSCWR